MFFGKHKSPIPSSQKKWSKNSVRKTVLAIKVAIETIMTITCARLPTLTPPSSLKRISSLLSFSLIILSSLIIISTEQRIIKKARTIVKTPNKAPVLLTNLHEIIRDRQTSSFQENDKCVSV